MWVAGPGVHRTGDDRAMWVKATLHALGAAVGGAILGAGVAQLGAALSPADRAAAGSLLGAALAVVSMLRLPVLERNTETPQSLLRLGSVGWSVANGALLGTAVTNRIGYWLWYAVPIGCFVSGEPLAGAAIWGVFVCARLATIIVVARCNDPSSGQSPPACRQPSCAAFGGAGGDDSTRCCDRDSHRAAAGFVTPDVSRPRPSTLMVCGVRGSSRNQRM